MCGCGCGLALALAEAQVVQAEAQAVQDGCGGVAPQVILTDARGWEALKRTLRGALGNHARTSAAPAAVIPA